VSRLARFRVNVFSQRDSIAMVFRAIPSEPPEIGDLNLPSVIEKITLEQRGLVLVTGVTGSGKTTTLAAMINHINSFRNCHLITIEDPIAVVEILPELRHVLNIFQPSSKKSTFKIWQRMRLWPPPEILHDCREQEIPDDIRREYPNR